MTLELYRPFHYALMTYEHHLHAKTHEVGLGTRVTRFMSDIHGLENYYLQTQKTFHLPLELAQEPRL